MEHFEELAGDSNLDARVSLELSSFLSPTLTVYRNTSDDLYTFELSAKHGVDNDIADLCFHALYGNTDITSSINEDYYGLGVIASKSVSENSTLGLSYDYFDSDLISNGESVLGLSLSVNF